MSLSVCHTFFGIKWWPIKIRWSAVMDFISELFTGTLVHIIWWHIVPLFHTFVRRLLTDWNCYTPFGDNVPATKKITHLDTLGQLGQRHVFAILIFSFWKRPSLYTNCVPNLRPIWRDLDIVPGQRHAPAFWFSALGRVPDGILTF